MTILLDELGIECEREIIDLQAGQHKGPEYLAIHPLGQVPALVDDDGETIIESVAICMYLAETFIDRGLAPPLDSPERGKYLQWCTYTLGSLEPAMMGHYIANKSESKEPPRGVPRLDDTLRVVSDGLEDRVTLLPSGFSCADVVVGSTVIYIELFGMDVPMGPALKRYRDALMERPAFARAFGGPDS